MRSERAPKISLCLRLTLLVENSGLISQVNVTLSDYINYNMDDKSFDEPTKRRRSSILKMADKRASRDSRTVSFNNQCTYKELHDDGTCDITNLFLRDDMDLTNIDIVEPYYHLNQTLGSNMDISANTQTNDEQYSQATIASADMSVSSLNSSLLESSIHSIQSGTNNEIQTISDIDCSTSTLVGARIDPLETVNKSDRSLSETMMIAPNNCSVSRVSGISEISSFNTATLVEQSLNETYYGAFHDSNPSILSTRSSISNTLVHNIEALNECIERIDENQELCRRKLDEEIGELFKFYRHIVNKENKYEFAIAIFGLRHSLWLILKLNPDTYPNEKISIKFAVNKRDRHLYPFAEYAEALRRTTKEGRPGYLTKFVINAQRFRRFLRKIGYKRPTEK